MKRVNKSVNVNIAVNVNEIDWRLAVGGKQESSRDRASVAEWQVAGQRSDQKD